VTLSQANLETGVDETMKQLHTFAAKGITEEELAEKKTTLTGSFKVGMSSTSAIAGSLLRNAEKEREPEYLDTFPERIEALTVEDVNEQINRYLHPDSLHMAVAGSIPEKK
jgi:predicted Zn-dependent peptidase